MAYQTSIRSIFLRASGGLVSLVVAATIAACMSSLANQSSGRVGCPASQIRISNERSGLNNRTWTATCHGRRYYCTETRRSDWNGGRNSDTSCTEDSSRRSQPQVVVVRTASPSPAPAPESSAPSVERVLVDGRVEFRGRLAATSPTVRIGHSPTRDPVAVFVALDFDSGASRASCASGLVVAGQVQPMTVVRATPTSRGEQLVLATSLDDVRRAASAPHASIRVCDLSIEVTDRDRETLLDFVRRIDDERAWQTHTASDAGVP